MPECSFCGTAELKEYPLCHSCGAIRYPVENSSVDLAISRQRKLKISAAVAAAIVTPGAFVVLALMGANHINTRIKKSENISSLSDNIF